MLAYLQVSSCLPSPPSSDFVITQVYLIYNPKRNHNQHTVCHYILIEWVCFVQLYNCHTRRKGNRTMQKNDWDWVIFNLLINNICLPLYKDLSTSKYFWIIDQYRIIWEELLNKLKLSTFWSAVRQPVKSLGRNKSIKTEKATENLGTICRRQSVTGPFVRGPSDM